MTDQPLPYATPAREKRPVGRMICFSIISIPLLASGPLLMAYSFQLLTGFVHVAIPLFTQILTNIFLFGLFLAGGLALANRGNPQRYLSPPVVRSFSRSSKIAALCAVAAYLSIAAFWPVKNLAVAHAPVHARNPIATAYGFVILLFIILPLSAFCSGALDLGLAFRRAIPLRGYTLSLIVMALALVWLPILSATQRPLIAAATRQFDERGSTIDVAVSLAHAARVCAVHTGTFPPTLDKVIDTITPEKFGTSFLRTPVPATDDEWRKLAENYFYPGADLPLTVTADGADLLLLIAKQPLLDAHEIYLPAATAAVDYGAAGYLVINATGRIEIISPTDWPARLQRDFAARQRLNLPPRSPPSFD